MRTGLVAGYGVLLVLTTGLVNLGGNMWGRIEQLQRLLPHENTVNLQGDIEMLGPENQRCEKLCSRFDPSKVQFYNGKCFVLGECICDDSAFVSSEISLRDPSK